MTAKTPARTPWSVPVRREDVPETGLHLDLAADEATRAAVATLAGLRELPRLEASFEVTRQGSGLSVIGEVSATVGQTCVVTLEPIASEVREPIDLVFVPAGTSAPAPASGEEIAVEGADEPEPLIDGRADLGVAATEFLLLAIDPYPRKPGVVFEAPTSEDPGVNPFAALAALKNSPSKP
jgi:uncharacterized metal-binding protein YceD (DUF177 family)